MQATSVTIWDEKNKKRRLWIIILLMTPLIFLGLVKFYYALHPLQGGFVSSSQQVIYPEDEMQYDGSTTATGEHSTSYITTSPQPASTLNCKSNLNTKFTRLAII